MRVVKALGSCVLFVLGTMSSITVRAADSPVIRCTSLAPVSIPASSIGLPTRGATITSVKYKAPGDPNGEHCEVYGAIHPVDQQAPDIDFELNLPTNWNHRAVHLGGGGYDGVLVTGLTANMIPNDVPQPLGRGFATFGSDSGHQSAAPFDASFALNDEALDNFGGNQLKKTHDVAVALIKRYYGDLPRRVYFQGNSQGGHEAFLVIQRWPDDYDGVVAVHPVYDLTALQLAGLAVGKALYAPGAWLSPQKAKLVYDAAMTACDALDGAADTVIGNVGGCRAAFKIEALRCADGKDAGDGCLSDAQIGAVRAIDSELQLGMTLQDGVSSFAHWPIVEGGMTSGFFSLGHSAAPSNPPVPTDAFAYVAADQLVRFMVLRDPKANSLRFDPTAHEARLERVSQIVDASSVAIESFRDRGGKLLLLHGTADMAVPPQNSIDYYDRLVERFGAKLPDFVRFYLVPGFGHGDGSFVASWDWLTAIDLWVEKGSVPTNQTVADSARATTGRTRPLCEYPAWPKYRSSGDVNLAASFSCATQ